MGRPTQHNHPPRPVRPPGGKVKTTRVRYAIPESHTRPPRHGAGPGKRGGGHSGRDTPGLFPFRTRKLRLPAPMVLHPPGCGRVGHRRLHTTKGGPATGPPFSRTHGRPHTRHSAPHTHGHTHPPHVRGHTGHSAPATQPHAPQKPHTRQSSPNRAGSLSIGFGLGLSCPRSRRTQTNTRTQVDAVGYETCV